MRYKDLYFGMSDARNEAISHNAEFVRSYVDLRGTIDDVLADRKFLVLGPKGTGKSAIAWYLRLTESSGTHFADVLDASVLPLADIPRIQTGQEAGPERTVLAWRFILLCNCLQLLLRSNAAYFEDDREIKRVAKLLREYGFMSDASGKALTNISSTTITIPIPKLGEIYKREQRSSLNIYNLTPYLESWVVTALSNTNHILLLDGLDSILLNDPKYDESLASLVQAAYTINQRSLERDSSAFIVLLMRNDVFARIGLSLPDSQKMRDDLSVQLDWRILSGAAGIRSPLMSLVNKKAARASGSLDIDVLNFFPHTMTLGSRQGRYRDIPIFQYLLNQTRHTPRDLLRLFEEIRKVAASQEGGRDRQVLPEAVIREGILKYAKDYFVGAISNEFAGIEGGPKQASAAISALKNIGKQEFDRADFKRALVELDLEETPRDGRLLELLFYAGALGNVVNTRGGERYLQFYHRRDDSEIYLKGKFILADPLVHAWGVPFGRGE
jgi:hypothetical protein